MRHGWDTLPGCVILLFALAAANEGCSRGSHPVVPPEQIPGAVFSSICDICMKLRDTDPRPGKKLAVVIVQQTQPIYYFRGLAQSEQDRQAYLLGEKLRRKAKTVRIDPALLPKGTCNWMLFDLERIKKGIAVPDAPGTFWVMISPPVINPFVDGREAVGVFVRIAWSRAGLLAFPGSRWWIGLREEDGGWRALPPRRIPVIEM